MRSSDSPSTGFGGRPPPNTPSPNTPSPNTPSPNTPPPNTPRLTVNDTDESTRVTGPRWTTVGWLALMIAVAAAVAMGPVHAMAPTKADSTKPADPTTTEAVADTQVKVPRSEIRLTQQGPVLRQDGVHFVDVEVLLPPGSDRNLEVAATVFQRIKTRAEFAQTNLNRALGSVIGIGASVAVQTDPETGSALTREVPIRLDLPIGAPSAACPSCINLRVNGVYPVMVELRSTTEETVVDRFTSYLIRAVNTNLEPLKVALIVPLRTDPSFDSAGEEQVPSTRNLISIIEALVARSSTPLTIAPTPETLDTLDRLSQQEANSSPLLDQMRQALFGREVLGTPYAPISAAISNDSVLKRLVQGNQAMGAATIRSLLQTRTTSGVGLFADHLVGSRTLSTLSYRRVVVQESALQAEAGGVPPTLPVLIDAAAIDNSDGVPVPGMVLDSALEDHFVRKLSDRSPGADDVLRAQHLIADLAMVQAGQRSGSHGAAVLVPESTSQATLSEVLAGLEAKEIIEPVTLSTLFSLPLASSGGTALVRSPKNAGATLPSRPARDINRILTRLDGYRSAFQGPATDADDLEKRLLVAVASLPPDRSATPGASFAAALKRIEDESNARIGTIHLSPTDIVTLTARQQEVPIPIINDSGQPTTVVLEVSSDNVSLEGSVADPNRPGQLLVRRTIVIQSRIHQEQIQVTTRGPGSFSMLLRLTTPSGLALTNVRYTLRSTAVGGLGKILTIGALLVLGAWWIRTILRTRRERSLKSHPSQVSPKRVGS